MTIPTFPTLAGVSWPVVRTRMSKTMVQESVSGKETRVQIWAYPKYKWALSFESLPIASTSPDFQTLMGFLNSVAGQGQPFYYTDPNDSVATAQPMGDGDGTTTSFQLVRSLGGFTEPVQVPLTITSVTVAGTPTTAYTLGTAGQITFATAPASGAALEWTGTYQWLCRLAADEHAFTQQMSTYFSADKIEFQNIKL